VENGRLVKPGKVVGAMETFAEGKVPQKGRFGKRMFLEKRLLRQDFRLKENRFHCKRSRPGIYCASAFSRKVFFDLKEKNEGIYESLGGKKGKGKNLPAFFGPRPCTFAYTRIGKSAGTREPSVQRTTVPNIRYVPSGPPGASNALRRDISTRCGPFPLLSKS
jgi:hypothetical protein